MASVTVFTVQFTGEGQVNCRRCDRAVIFSEGQWLVLIDTGFTMECRSALDTAIVHRCGWLTVWRCRDCGAETELPRPAPLTGRRRRRRQGGPARGHVPGECDACGSVDLRPHSRPPLPPRRDGEDD